MIIWIILYLFLLIYIFIKYKYKWIHFVWGLIPIQFFGIDLFGAKIKPYMIYTFFIFLFGNKKYKINIITAIIIFVIILCQIFVNFFNDSNIQSYKNQLIVFSVWFFAYIYYNQAKNNKLDEILYVIFYCGIMYGIISIIAVVFHKFNMLIPGLYSTNRFIPGLFLKYDNMFEESFITFYRYRGFTGDPNLVSISFTIPCIIGFYLFRLQEQSLLYKIQYLILLLLSFITIYYTNSRTGLIVFVISLLIEYILFEKNNIIKIIFAILFLFFVYYYFGNFDLLSILFQYKRSSLLSDYGRMSIWMKSIKILLNNNIYFGIGTSRMVANEYNSIYTHNTWVEWICGNGIIFGLIIDLFFFFLGIYYLLKEKINLRIIISLVNCYYAIVISLFTVDEIANCYIVYFIMLLFLFTNKNINNIANIN